MNKNEKDKKRNLVDDQFTEKDIEQIFGGASVLADSLDGDVDAASSNRQDKMKQQEQYTHASDNIS